MENIHISRDLVDYHHSIANMFVQSKKTKEWESYMLTEEQIASLKKEAFDKKVANELPKGYASFQDPLTMHGTYANTSEPPRRATVMNTMSCDTLGNTEGYYRFNALHTFS